MKRLLGTTAAVAATCLLTVGLATPALAATTDTAPPVNGHSSLSAIQQAGADATAKRITALNQGITKVGATSTLTAADRSTILGTLNADLGGMNSLQTKIAADTDVATALADYRDIFTGYRVFAVALPQSYTAATADGITGTAIPKLQAAASGIQSVFTAFPAKATPALQAQLADMQAKIGDAQAKTNGLAASALAVTPAAYNANHAVLSDDRAAARDALADTKAATADGQAILKAIQ